MASVEAFCGVYVGEVARRVREEEMTPARFFKLNETYCFQKDMEARIVARRDELMESQERGEVPVFDAAASKV